MRVQACGSPASVQIEHRSDRDSIAGWHAELTAPRVHCGGVLASSKHDALASTSASFTCVSRMRREVADPAAYHMSLWLLEPNRMVDELR